MGNTYAVIPAGDFQALKAAVDFSSYNVPHLLFTIYLEAGDYVFTETLVVLGQIAIYGRGYTETKLKYSGSFNGMFTLVGPSLLLDSVGIHKGRTSTVGAGVWVQGANSHLTVTNSRFKDNVADEYGGAIYLGNGSLTIRNSVFKDNGAYRGGAIYNTSAVTDAIDARDIDFVDNVGGDAGAVLYNAVDPQTRSTGLLYVQYSNFQTSTSAATIKVRKHIYAPDTSPSVFAKFSYWISPKVDNSPNLYGVKTGDQATVPLVMVTDTPEPLPILTAYNVFVEGPWSPEEKLAIENGVIKTGQALQLQFGGASPADAFRRVMIAPNRKQIVFLKVTENGPFCDTTSFHTVSGEYTYQARIVCFADNQISEYTAVHELGHVFSGRMGGQVSGTDTYFGLFDNLPLTTTPGVLGPLLDSAGFIVMGRRNFDPTEVPPVAATVSDWTRGGRGWGSAAVTPPVVPCAFQQNSFVVDDWIVRAFTPTPAPAATSESAETVLIREIEEASSDMFLNWVYRKLGAGGFVNLDWRSVSIPPDNCLTGAPTDISDSGDARFRLMETVVLTRVLTQIPPMTSTP
ncbi:MAG: hypothetical protein IPM16_17555 [Chloroflexi bacterium]|nr:hypothetical protein [Chloroflexota bacterium]